MLNKRAVLDQLLVSCFNIHCKVRNSQLLLGWFFTQSHVQGLDAEVASVGDCPIDIVTQPLEKLSGLGLNDWRFLFIASVKSKGYKLRWFIIHILSFRFSSLDQVKTNIKNKIWQKSEEHIFELFILGGDTEVLECFFNKTTNGFFIKKEFQISSLSKDNQWLNQ